MKDYYSILGVSRIASQAEIKSAYRRLAILYHPDKNKDPRAQEIFVEVTEAYDVIVDPIKRRGYDGLLSGIYSTATVTKQTEPRHRDPAYRRRQSHSHVRPLKKSSDTYTLMKEYLKYFKWAGRIGLVVSVLFFIDYVLPYKTTHEKINRIYEVRGKRNSTAYNIVVTESGKEIKLYDGHAGVFFNEQFIQGEYTMIYKTPMHVSTPEGTYRVRLAYMYQGQMLFPLALLITAVLSIVYHERIEFCFNANLVCGVLLVVFLILL